MDERFRFPVAHRCRVCGAPLYNQVFGAYIEAGGDEVLCLVCYPWSREEETYLEQRHREVLRALPVEEAMRRERAAGGL